MAKVTVYEFRLTPGNLSLATLPEELHRDAQGDQGTQPAGGTKAPSIWPYESHSSQSVQSIRVQVTNVSEAGILDIPVQY